MLEQWGIRKIEHYYASFKQVKKFDNIEALYRSYTLLLGTIFAFFIGSLLTVPIIFIELKWQIFTLTEIDALHILL